MIPILRFIFGALIIIFPFYIIDTKKNNVIILPFLIISIILLHFFVAFFLQALSVFTYPILIFTHVLILILMYIICDYFNMLRNITFYNIGKCVYSNGSIILLIFIATMDLASMHYYYSGKYTVETSPQYLVANHTSYAYPYFADEWYAVALINNSFTNHSLPVRFPFEEKVKPFTNLELAFHTLLGGFILLLSSNVLLSYVPISIVINVLNIALLYIFITKIGVSKTTALIVSLSSLYITNGANLPGLWYLLPLSFGILFILTGMIGIAQNHKFIIYFSSFAISIFYPPLILLLLAALWLSFVYDEESSYQRKKDVFFIFIRGMLIGALMLASFYFFSPNQNNLLLIIPILAFIALTSCIAKTFVLKHAEILKRASSFSYLSVFFLFLLFPFWYFLGTDHSIFYRYALSRATYQVLTIDSVPQYVIYNIVPIPLLLLACMGVFILLKQKNCRWLMIAPVIGFIYWIFASFTTARYFIEYQRIVIVTALLILPLSAKGLEICFVWLRKVRFENLSFILSTAIIILFIGGIYGYSWRDQWKKLVLINQKTGQVFLPAAPVNRYLQADDLRVFRSIHGKRFLSLPWKGTVLGVATNNYPVSIKAGTITLNRGLSSKFMESDCTEKNKIVVEYSIDYVYLPAFSCPRFKYVDSSAEKLLLYEVTPRQ